MTAGKTPAAKTRWQQDRRFFTGMALVSALIVFVGFAPSFYLKSLFESRSLPLRVHVHGVLFTMWILFFVIQVTLVATKRVKLHRQLGTAGAFLGAAMFAQGMHTAIAAAGRGFTGLTGWSPHQFMVFAVVDILVFAMLLGAGIYMRRRSNVHRRLMLLATLSIMTPAVARLLLYFGIADPVAWFAFMDIFIIICVIYEKLTRGRISSIFIWGGVFIISTQVLRFWVGKTAGWTTLAKWMTG